jgi:hypothetical protein
VTADLSLELYDPPIPQAPAELSHLERSLRADGLLDPLLVWRADDGRLVLIDGAARKALCDKLGIEPRVREVPLPDLHAVAEFRLRVALGRRNLTPFALSYQRGELYSLIGRRQGLRTDRPGHRADWKRTAAGIAAEFGVSERTVRRDAAFYRAAKALGAAERMGPDFLAVLLAGQSNLKRKGLILLSR